MSFPTRGTRRVQLNGTTFLWHIRRKPTTMQAAFRGPMRLAVRRQGGASVLVVDLGVSRPDNWIDPHQTSVTPAVVREIVAAALEAGWDPESEGVFPCRFGLIRDRS